MARPVHMYFFIHPMSSTCTRRSIIALAAKNQSVYDQHTHVMVFNYQHIHIVVVMINTFTLILIFLIVPLLSSGMFASPSVPSIYAAIRTCTVVGAPGCLLIVKVVMLAVHFFIFVMSCKFVVDLQCPRSRMPPSTVQRVVMVGCKCVRILVAQQPPTCVRYTLTCFCMTVT